MGLFAAVSVAASAFLAAGVPAPAQAEADEEMKYSHLSIFGHARAWWPEIRGSGTYDEALGTDYNEADLEASRCSFERDGGFDGSRLAVDFAIGLAVLEKEGRRETGGGGRFSYWGVRGSADHVLEEPEDVGAAVLPAGTPVESRLTVDYYRIELAGWTRQEPWEFRFSTGLGFFRAILDFETPSGDLGTASGAIGFPFGGGAAWHPTPWSSVSAEAGFLLPFMTGTWIFELTALAGCRWEGVQFEAGYRSFWAHYGSSDDAFRISLRGPFLGISFRF